MDNEDGYEDNKNEKESRLFFKLSGNPFHFPSRTIVSTLYNVGSEVHYLRYDQSKVTKTQAE